MIFLKNKPTLVKLRTNEFIDPEFLKLESLSVQEAQYCSPDIVVEKLAHRITRMPNDLRSHVQRIFIFIAQAETSHIFSALVDLFLALENNGLALRKRLLTLSKPYLFEDQYLSLQSALEKGTLDETTSPQPSQSLLSKGHHNNQDFIIKPAQNDETLWAVKDQVNSYIEFGQIEQAKRLLQQTILKISTDNSLLELLLEIFLKTADRAGFLSFYQLLQQEGIALPDTWQNQANDYRIRID